MKCPIILLVLLLMINGFMCSQPEAKTTNQSDSTGNLLETGRTFVHHAIKRLTFILPAIFFKMGVAFTLLILVTIVAVNNGVIGFMLLVVGLSSVLARLQEARKPTIPIPVPHYPHYAASFYDRSDSIAKMGTKVTDDFHTKDVNYPYQVIYQ